MNESSSQLRTVFGTPAWLLLLWAVQCLPASPRRCHLLPHCRFSKTHRSLVGEHVTFQREGVSMQTRGRHLRSLLGSECCRHAAPPRRKALQAQKFQFWIHSMHTEHTSQVTACPTTMPCPSLNAQSHQDAASLMLDRRRPVQTTASPRPQPMLRRRRPPASHLPWVSPQLPHLQLNRRRRLLPSTQAAVPPARSLRHWRAGLPASAARHA